MAGRKDLFHPDHHQVDILNDKELSMILGGMKINCSLYSCNPNQDHCSPLTCSTYCSTNTIILQ
jgi:hypothetical protein